MTTDEHSVDIRILVGLEPQIFACEEFRAPLGYRPFRNRALAEKTLMHKTRQSNPKGPINIKTLFGSTRQCRRDPTQSRK